MFSFGFFGNIYSSNTLKISLLSTLFSLTPSKIYPRSGNSGNLLFLLLVYTVEVPKKRKPDQHMKKHLTAQPRADEPDGRAHKSPL